MFAGALAGLALLLVAALAPASAAVAGLPADQGTGNPVLAVAPTALPADQVTTVTVTGTDYLVPPHAPGIDVFGGIYLFFGWVSDPGRFGPSIRNSVDNDGTFGVTYAYPGDGGDPGTRDDGTGAMRLVSFTAGSESGQATGLHMDDHGNWSATLRIYGSQFVTTNPVTGESRLYDCQQVQCGVFTVGAHGTASATNERFAPVTFTGSPPPAPLAPTPDGGPGAGAGGGVGSGDGTAGGAGAGGAGGSAQGTGGGGASTAGSDATTAPTITDGPSPSTTEHADGEEALTVGISSTRDTGGVGVPLVAGVVGVAVAGAGAVRWRRRHTTTTAQRRPPTETATD